MLAVSTLLSTSATVYTTMVHDDEDFNSPSCQNGQPHTSSSSLAEENVISPLTPQMIAEKLKEEDFEYLPHLDILIQYLEGRMQAYPRPQPLTQFTIKRVGNRSKTQMFTRPAIKDVNASQRQKVERAKAEAIKLKAGNGQKSNLINFLTVGYAEIFPGK